MAEALHRVELTASFLERLESIKAFLSEADASVGFDDLLAELRATVLPNLSRFPKIGRRYIDNPPQSAEALTALSSLPSSAINGIREYQHGEYLVLYATKDEEATVSILCVRHHREISSDFARLWPLKTKEPKNDQFSRSSN